jgi:GGDEF domain-containing protein
VVDDLRTHQPPRARPVGDLPVDAVLACADELARRWAIALILARPLDRIGDLPVEELAREAPSLCAQAVRALQSDVELDRLTGQGAPSGRGDSAPSRRLAAIAGARNPAAAVEAVEALRGVLWEALLDQLNEPSARQVGDLSDRLAYVCAAALAAAVDAALAPGAHASFDDAQAEIRISEPTARDLARAPQRGRQAVIVDERECVPVASPARKRAPSWDASLPVPPPAAQAVEVEIRDERSEEGPAAWIRSIGGQLERFERDRLPFVVLLVELVDIERLRRDERPEELSALGARVEQALASQLRARPGSLTRERPGRWWLLMAETDRAGARERAERLTRAVASCASDRRAPLEVAVGMAVCPADGREAAALAAHADAGLYAVRSVVRASAGRPAATPVDEPA